MHVRIDNIEIDGSDGHGIHHTGEQDLYISRATIKNTGGSGIRIGGGSSQIQTKEIFLDLPDYVDPHALASLLKQMTSTDDILVKEQLVNHDSAFIKALKVGDSVSNLATKLLTISSHPYVQQIIASLLRA
jgi:hypothetical protein